MRIDEAVMGAPQKAATAVAGAQRALQQGRRHGTRFAVVVKPRVFTTRLLRAPISSL